MLTKVLASQLGRPVQDRTGFNGVFDFTLRWSPDTQSATDDTETARRSSPPFGSSSDFVSKHGARQRTSS